MNTEFISKSLAPKSQQLGPVEKWAYGMLNAVIIGGATAVVSAGGLATAHGLGDTQVPVLNLHIVGIIFLSGAGSKFFIYLSQGLPKIEDNQEQKPQP